MKPFSNLELSSFCGQIALILKSGISPIEGLTIMLEDTTSPDEKEILTQLLVDMQETGSLHLALAATNIFPVYMLHMVEIGEETGTLDNVMESLKTHYDRENAIRKTLRNSVTYPMIMTGMMTVVVVILLVKVMPIFNQVFIQLGTEMTGFSRMLMNMGTALNRYSVLFIVILLVIAGMLFYGTRITSGRKFFRKLGYHLSFTKTIHEKIAACRFADGMALTLTSGLSPERSLELVTSLNEDSIFQQKIDCCQKELNEGKDLSEALLISKIFTGMYARMTSIGSKTGALDETMEEIAGLYQDEIDSQINNLLAILEPTLVVILSLIVGSILLSVMLPLIGIISGI